MNLPLKGYEGLYSISSEGYISSLKTGLPKATSRCRKGYHHVSLWKNGVQKGTTVHRLVALHFLPLLAGNEKVAARHLDGDPSNNHVSNIAWGTYSENEIDKRLHGTDQTGERNGYAKLTEPKVIEIRKLWEQGNLRQPVIAKMFGLAQPTVSNIVKRKIWKHI